MASRVPPIARIRLARSRARILAIPAVVGLFGIVGVALGALVAVGAIPGGPVVGIVAGVVGIVLVLVAVRGALRPLTAALDVEEASVRLHWLGGERVYTLAPGPVTRVRLRGEQPSTLRAPSGHLGWILGPATLRDEEQIEAIRLAATDTAILVPTERGRLAIAPASEDELLDALSRAARARQRLEELAGVDPDPAPESAWIGGGVASGDATAVDDDEDAPHVLTGIERALLEEQLLREEAERARRAAMGDAGGETTTAIDAAPVDAGTGAGSAVDSPRRRRVRIDTARLRRPRPSAAFVLLPLLAAGGVWAAATVLARLPEAGSDLGRLTSLALVLGGPATSIGAIMARAWWPRLVGVVVAGGIVTSVFVGRALFGG